MAPPPRIRPRRIWVRCRLCSRFFLLVVLSIPDPYSQSGARVLRLASRTRCSRSTLILQTRWVRRSTTATCSRTHLYPQLRHQRKPQRRVFLRLLMPSCFPARTRSRMPRRRSACVWMLRCQRPVCLSRCRLSCATTLRSFLGMTKCMSRASMTFT